MCSSSAVGSPPTARVRRLRGSIKRGDVRVTVVTRDNALAVHGLIGEMVTGRILASTVLNPGRRVFAPARLHVAEIESIDIEARTVVTSRHLDGARFELDYDRAVVCIGTRREPRALPGARGARVPPRRASTTASASKNHVVEMLELADIETDPEERRRLLTVLRRRRRLLGDGLAGELADLIRAAHEARVPGNRARGVPRPRRSPRADAAAGVLRVEERGASPNAVTRASSSTR